MERALLEGEQQIQLEQLDAAEEKIASLERREAELLAEAADQRSKVNFAVNVDGCYIYFTCFSLRRTFYDLDNLYSFFFFIDFENYEEIISN